MEGYPLIGSRLHRLLPTVMSLLAVFFINSCAVGPNFHSPAPPKTNRYTYSPTPQKTTSANMSDAGKSQTLTDAKTIPAQWWQLFHSRTLNQLIQMGLANNPTLEAAKKSLEVAEQTLRVQVGNLLIPAVDLAFNAQRSQIGTIQFGLNAPTNIFSVYNTQAQASYLLDIFGGNRRQVEYYAAQVDYQRYELLAAYLTLTSNITTTAITIASLEAQIQATHELIATERNVLDIQKAQFADGGISQEDVLTQETLLAQTIAELPPLQKSLAQENHALAVLIGALTSQKPPTHLSLDELHLPAHLPVSLPSHLVRQRPDILASEALLHGMSANIGVATANLLPQITLSAYYGWTADALSRLFQPASNVWSLAGALLQPFFHGGALIAARRAAVAQFQQFYAQYQNVVLQAFKNVADALRAIQFDAAEFKAQVNAEITAKKTLNTATRRYQLGGQNYLTVLNSQQHYLEIKINRIQAQAARYTDTAALFQALGGGWWNQTLIGNHPCASRRSNS